MTRTLAAVLVTLALVAAVTPAPGRADGIRGILDGYVDAVADRVAGQGDPDREADLSRRIVELVTNGDDLSEIVVAYLTRAIDDAGLSQAETLLPFDGRRAAAFRNLHGADEGAPAPAAVEPTRWGWGSSGDIPPDLSKFTRMTDQKPTYYITAFEQGFPTSGSLYGHYYDGSEKRTIRTPSGTTIATTSGRFFAALCMEGSGVLKDGRGVTYVSNQRFNPMPSGCLGVTATGRWVVPFHTLAVNKKEFPYGGVYYVPALRGKRMPDGSTHDGYWFAHDTGGAFSGTPKHRIDMYVSRDEWVAWFEKNFVPSFTAIHVWRVDDATRAKVYERYQSQLGAADTEAD